jgi:hypothetical protein
MITDARLAELRILAEKLPRASSMDSAEWSSVFVAVVAGFTEVLTAYGLLRDDHMAIIRRLEREEKWVRVHKDAGDTETAAAEAAELSYTERPMQVMKYLIACGGDFDTHGSDTTNIWLNSYAPARNALMRKGYVRDSGRRGINERGNKAIIWIPTEAGRDWYKRACAAMAALTPTEI